MREPDAGELRPGAGWGDAPGGRRVQQAPARGQHPGAGCALDGPEAVAEEEGRGAAALGREWHDDAAAMLRKDLEAAKIPYQTDDGSYFDFHATLHTGITRGSKLMQVDQLRQFARHSKVETTMRYVHTDADEFPKRADELSAPGCEDGQPSGGGANGRGEKCDHKCEHGCGSDRQSASLRRSNWHCAGNDTTPCRCKGLSSTDARCPKRGRRGSNPQPPDRQSGTLTN